METENTFQMQYITPLTSGSTEMYLWTMHQEHYERGSELQKQVGSVFIHFLVRKDWWLNQIPSEPLCDCACSIAILACL